MADSATLVSRCLLSGNEAIARGAWEAGVKVASGYPGTPSTEILENLARYPDVYCEWAPNEKVAMEVVSGASFGGVRALATMKHVGVNVAADPLLTLAYTGVCGGVVFISADDPGMHSSQNEQDNRHYGRMASIPVLEPSDSQEAYEFTKLAFELSERFDTPVMVRTSTRIAHSAGPVRVGERAEAPCRPFAKNPGKFVMIPAYARRRHGVVLERERLLREFAEEDSINRIEWDLLDLGVVCSGIAYQYVREAYPEASVFKLGMTWPLPERKLMSFASEVKRVVVVEELDPFLETELRAMGIPCAGKELIPREGELDPGIVRAALTGQALEPRPSPDLPARPPVLCPGCPHRGVFWVLNRMRAIVPGDIGCYTLGALPPLSSLDICISMGASVGSAIGMERARSPEDERPLVAVIGDSTFIHSGISGLIDAVYNGTKITLVILDNKTTAMTGGQDHPGTGRTLMGTDAPVLDLVRICEAVGVGYVRRVDPLNLEETRAAIEEGLKHPGPAVIVAESPCALQAGVRQEALVVETEDCSACQVCFRLGCPALSGSEEDVRNGRSCASIDPLLCRGCSLCEQMCPRHAIHRAGEQTEAGR
jgi:indolepyruvate ferredoxin oxidoreductase alpha subunit